MTNNINLSDKDKEYLKKCINAIAEIAYKYGYVNKNKSDFKYQSTYDHWVKCSDIFCGDVVAFVQWKISSYYNAYNCITMDYDINTKVDFHLLSVTDNHRILLAGGAHKYLKHLQKTNPCSFLAFVILVKNMNLPYYEREKSQQYINILDNHYINSQIYQNDQRYIDRLENQYNELFHNLETHLETHAKLKEKYDRLLDDYEDLEDKYDRLVDDYDYLEVENLRLMDVIMNCTPKQI